LTYPFLNAIRVVNGFELSPKKNELAKIVQRDENYFMMTKIDGELK